MLARQLRADGHHVEVITFRRQYPAMLYPGRFQEEAGGAPPDGLGPTRRMIDSLNPATWLTTGWRLAREGFDLYIFKFWLPLFGPAFGAIARRVRRSGRVLVIVDNLLPHERRPGDIRFTRYLFAACDMAVTQSSTVSSQFAAMFPSIPERMLPHPTYEQFGRRIDRPTAREHLGITAERVLLFFGFVRRYKGLDRLLEAMPEILRRIPSAHLCVVGEFFEPRRDYEAIIERCGVRSHVTLVDRYIANDEVAWWFSAADMLVLPYHNATNSGIVQIGYNFAVPAIVTDVGSLSEVVLNGTTGFVLDDAAPATIAEAVARMYADDTIARFSAAIVRERDRYTWSAFAAGLITFARENGAGG